MPYQFTLPTTSSVPIQSCISSTSHPSLPSIAILHRSVLRNALKQHKRLPPKAQTTNLNNLLSALNSYLPYLFALDAGLSDHTINGEEIEAALRKELEIEWRSSLTASIPGRERPRVKGRGLDYEICCVLSIVGYVHNLLARSQLHMLYAAVTPNAEQRLAIVNAATKHMLSANSVYAYLPNRSNEAISIDTIPETSSSAQEALARLAMAEATLLAVLKDDPWPGVVAQDRNRDDKEWMIKPPEIPKVRTHLFARLCLAAGEHAATAEAMFNAVVGGRSRIDQTLIKYVTDLKRTSRAKSCRFFGIDADMGGETGKGIAWLNAGEVELGYGKAESGGSKLQSLSNFKKDWTEKREDKKIEKCGDWGSDAGRFEEARIIELLKKKWNKMNDTINTQVVPPHEPLIASMPSGRDIHQPKVFSPPALDVDTLERLRAPPSAEDTIVDDSGSSSDGETSNRHPANPPGAFPTESARATGDSYY